MASSAGFGLEPRSIGELLDLTFRVFRARFKVFAALGIGLAFVNAGASIVVGAVAFADLSFAPESVPTLATLGWLYGAATANVLITIVVVSAGFCPSPYSSACCEVPVM